MSPSLDNVMQHLRAKALLGDGELAAVMQFAEARQHSEDLPIYLHLLAGVGAFLAAIFFIGFLLAAGIVQIESETTLIAWGLVFMGGGFALYRLGQADDGSLAHSFILQTSFCAMAVGKTAFVAGCAIAADSRWGVTIAALLITLFTYPLYRLVLDRFLSSFAVFMSLFVNILIEESYLLFNVAFLTQAAVMFLLLTYGRVTRAWEPLAYALVMSICVMTGFVASESMIGYQAEMGAPMLVQATLTGVLIASILWAAGQWSAIRREPVLVAILGALLLSLLSTPGVFLGMILLILGYARHDNILLSLGGIFVPVFLTLYYYNLELNLAMKSAVLAGSGALLLLGSAYIYVRHQTRGV